MLESANALLMHVSTYGQHWTKPMHTDKTRLTTLPALNIAGGLFVRGTWQSMHAQVQFASNASTGTNSWHSFRDPPEGELYGLVYAQPYETVACFITLQATRRLLKLLLEGRYAVNVELWQRTDMQNGTVFLTLQNLQSHVSIRTVDIWCTAKNTAVQQQCQSQ